MARTIIDASGCSYLAICTACGARTLPAMSREEALHEARHHEQRAHPGDLQTAQALAKQRARHAEPSAPDSSNVNTPAQGSQREPDSARRTRRRAADPL